MSENITQLLPHSIEAEKAVLGAILKDPNALNLISDKTRLESEQFFLETHRRIFQSMLDLDVLNEPADLITVANKLKNDDSGEAIGPGYLVDLTESCPVTHNIDYYASIVKNSFFRRKVIDACNVTIQQAKATEGSIGSFVDVVEKAFLDITNEQDKAGGLVIGRDVLADTIKELEKRIESDEEITGVSSGFHDLDAITGGWQKSDLIIMAARPGMGKTAMALNWFLNAVKAGKTCAFFTLEMSKEQLMERLLSSEGRVDSSRMRKGDLTDDDLNRLSAAGRNIHKYDTKISIDETPSITLSELRSRCRRYHKEHGLDMIMIDYLQLMGSNGKSDNREREVSEISMGLKALAKELGVPVITLAQLNRGPDARTDKRPKTSDLRESGSIEQDADLILFIYRDEYYNPNSEHAGKAELILAKNRHGEVGTVNLAFLPNFVSFSNLHKEV